MVVSSTYRWSFVLLLYGCVIHYFNVATYKNTHSLPQFRRSGVWEQLSETTVKLVVGLDFRDQLGPSSSPNFKLIISLLSGPRSWLAIGQRLQFPDMRDCSHMAAHLLPSEQCRGGERKEAAVFL